MYAVELHDFDISHKFIKARLCPLNVARVRLSMCLRPKRIDNDSPELPEVSKTRIFKLLAALNPSKACGPDKIPNWMLKDYAELLSNQQNHQLLLERTVSSEDLEIRGRVYSTKSEAG